MGATLYKLLCGKAPFSGERLNTPGKFVVALATETPPSLGELCGELPKGLVAIVDRMLARVPAERPATPADVAKALAPFAVGANLTRLAHTARQHGTLSDSVADQLISPARPLLPLRRRSIPKKRVALALASALLMLLAAVVYRIQTDQGTLVVTIEDPAVQAILEQDALVIRDKTSDRTWVIRSTEVKPLPSGKYQVEGKQNLQLLVTDDSGAEVTTNEFTLKRKGEVRMRVVVEQAASAAGNNSTDPTASDPDRRAAEYVLSIGGTIGFMENGKERSITAVADLPQGAFALTLLSLNWNPKASDAGLASCKGCTNIAILNLDGTQVSDAGLINFKDCNNLTMLALHGTRVTDAGLALFKGSRDLKHFDVGGTSVSDVGLANFRDCRNLTSLDASCAQLTDAGLAYFKDCKNLTTLRVSGPNVTDAGLANFKDCQDLTTLGLGGDQISDAGLANFKDCTKISGLWLNCAKMTEAGLLTFKDCRIGGLYLAESQATDAWLAHFKNWKTTLAQLLLGGTQITDAGLAHLKDFDIYVLQITDTQVSDAGLAHLTGFKHLGALDLTRMQVSDAGLEHLAKIQSLGAVELRGTQVTAAGVAKLQTALPNCQMTWEEKVQN